MGIFIIAVKSIILYNRKVLLIKRSGGEYEWECPGGKVEFGESLEDALRREIKEETGLENIRIEQLIYAMTGKINLETQLVGLMYLSYADNDKIALSPHEHKDFIWVDKKQFINLLDKNMLKELNKTYIFDTLDID